MSENPYLRPVDDELGCWPALIPVAAEVLKGMSSGDKGGTSPSSGNATGGFDIGGILKNIVGGLLPGMGGGQQSTQMQPRFTQTTQGGMTPEMIQSIVRAQMAQMGMRGGTGMGCQPGSPCAQGGAMGAGQMLTGRNCRKGQAGCMAGDRYSAKYDLCFDPNYFMDEDQAYQSCQMVAGGIPTQRPLPRATTGGKRGSKGKRSKKGLRGVYGMGGAFLGNVEYDLGAAAPSEGPGLLTAALIGVGAIAAGIFGTMATTRHYGVPSLG